MREVHKLPQPNSRDTKPACMAAYFIFTAILFTIVIGHLKCNRLLGSSSFSRIIPSKEIHGTDNIGIVAGKMVLHPYVTDSYPHVLTPSMIDGMTTPFSICLELSPEHGIDLRMLGSSGVPAIDFIISSISPTCLTRMWREYTPPYITPMETFKIRVQFYPGGQVNVFVKEIDGVQLHTSTAFYGPSRQGRYVSNIIPMQRFTVTDVDFVGRAQTVYNNLNNSYQVWCGRGDNL